MGSIRSRLVTAVAVGAAAVSGAAIANAATSGNAPSSSPSVTFSASPPATNQGRPPRGGHTVNGKTEKPLTGDMASKVRAAALAKVPGTVERVETNVDSSAPYEAHIRKSDGTEVEVQVSSDFTVSAVNQMGHP
jgi:hypothetical protein